MDAWIPAWILRGVTQTVTYSLLNMATFCTADSPDGLRMLVRVLFVCGLFAFSFD